jgi:predicted transcriptional regulator with HTH domain
MPATTTKPKAAAASSSEKSKVSLKDPSSVVKAYFGLVTKLLGKQEQVALRLIEKAPKGKKKADASK